MIIIALFPWKDGWVVYVGAERVSIFPTKREAQRECQRLRDLAVSEGGTVRLQDWTH